MAECHADKTTAIHVADGRGASPFLAITMRTYRNFIDGHFVEPQSQSQSQSQSAAFSDVDNPATSAVIARVTLASKDDALSAVEAASRAQKKWRALTAIERGEHLRRFADAIVERAPQIGAALALESGKSVADSENESDCDWDCGSTKRPSMKLR